MDSIDFARADELLVGNTDQAARRHRSSSTPGQDPDSLREAGKAAFRAGKWDEARQLYTRLIEAVGGESATAATAYANRAAVHLKLKEYVNAERDACAVVDMAGPMDVAVEPSILVKALHRRAQARVELGKMLEAAIDLQAVLEIEPHNAASREKLKELQALLPKDALLSETTMESERPKIVPLEDSGVPTRKASGPKNAPRRLPGPRQTGKASDNTAVKAIDVQAIREALGTASRPLPIPSTGYEFETGWKSTRDDSASRSAYLSRIPLDRLPRLLDYSLTSDLVLEIAHTAAAMPQEQNHPVSVLETLSRVQRFDMILMFLSADEKKVLTQDFKTLRHRFPDRDDTIARLEKIYKA